MRSRFLRHFFIGLVVIFLPQLGFSRVLIEAGLGPVYYQGEGVQGSWLNPAVDIGIDLVQHDTFRMTLMGDYHFSQSATQDFQFIAPGLRFYNWHDWFRYYLEVGGTLAVFSRNPIPGSTLLFAQVGGESPLGGQFDIGFGITGVCLLNNTSLGVSGIYMSYLEGHIYLQFSLPTGKH